MIIFGSFRLVPNLLYSGMRVFWVSAGFRVFYFESKWKKNKFLVNCSAAVRIACPCLSERSKSQNLLVHHSKAEMDRPIKV